MRLILVLLGLALVVLIVLISLGMIQITQTQPAQAPKFQADVGKIDVGTENKTIRVPKLEVEKPGNDQAFVGNSY
ncbi:hypothetical protein [Stakelama marina]|uniref:Uncharacterized protein n=1 Tax=Stakelama marina TaxID=2826939 RepID=A0A8T4IGY6_9SPHN|nr:hypothetical protein [Stakelama marina]MBR0552325.1 hypothetical protein [Stakelama marina]